VKYSFAPILQPHVIDGRRGVTLVLWFVHNQNKMELIMNKHFVGSILAVTVAVSGCASMFGKSVSETWDEGIPASYDSKLSALDLANCIDANSHYSWAGTQKSTLKQLGPDRYQVIRASEQIISSVTRISPSSSGSRADFRFNGFDVGISSHVADMTKGCE
jgi:hypothetical protein